jgi:hypothetical protein
MKKALLTGLYISLFFVMFFTSGFAAWPPPGTARNVYHVDQPPEQLDDSPWGVPLDSSPDNKHYNASNYYISFRFMDSNLGYVLFSMGNAMFGDRFTLSIIYRNHLRSDYGKAAISARILYR